ncbi:MAG TPA: prolipoprotein diacylglyceryl transferase [bacterium]|nr:prolipoprotein diacylglyceryl transferase [bacterium]
MPSPVLYDFGPVSLHWYGFLISLSIAISYLIGQKLFRRYQLPGQLFFDLVFYLIIFGLFGGRLWHVFSELSYYAERPLDILKIWQGGLAIHGTIVAGIIVLYFYYRRHRQALKDITWLLLLDIFSPLIVLGQAIGRFGNYFNQELYGRPTDLPWGIPIDLAHRLPGWENFSYFHPIFLYESLWCLVIFFILMSCHRRRSPNSYQPTNLPTYQPGSIFFSYLILYSLGRFLIGFLRIDPQVGLLGLRLDQWVSVIFILVGIIYFVRVLYCRRK